MHRLIGITGFVIAGACAMACGGREPEATSMTALTAARAAEDRSFEDRISTAVCVHEVECGRSQPATCLSAQRDRTVRELNSWSCSGGDAEVRAHAEQCLAAVRGESCSVDLTERPNVCPLSTACSKVDTVPPGAAAAESWRR
jgi:hypothetical protein